MVGGLRELVVHDGEGLPQLADGQGRADPRDDVLALGVRQELPVQLLLSRRRIPGERDARAGVGSHVPEDHRLHVRSGPEVVGDLVEVPVIHRALPVPGTEDRGDRLLQLLAAILRKGLTDLGLVQFLELCHDGLQIVGGKLGVLRRVGCFLTSFEERLELAAVDIFDDPTEHRDEPSIGVPRESFIRDPPERLDRLVVQSEVEDRVHHPRHGELRARSDGDEEGIRRVAEPTPNLRFDRRQRRFDLFPQAWREPTRPSERVAGFRGDREAGRDGEAEPGHLGEPGTLAAEQVPHRGVSFFEWVDVLRQPVPLS